MLYLEALYLEEQGEKGWVHIGHEVAPFIGVESRRFKLKKKKILKK